MPRTIIFVTGNPGKLKETKSILGDGDATWTLDSKALDLPEIQGTTQEVALEKCRKAAELIGGPCITEDTALCFEALGGLPGPYIKHFLTNIGLDGLNTLLEGFPTKNATALCTFAYSAGPGTEPLLFEGRAEGRIVAERGPPTFGWNPIFEAKETGKTWVFSLGVFSVPLTVLKSSLDDRYAEMTDQEKNSISHRYRALEKLRAYLQSLP